MKLGLAIYIEVSQLALPRHLLNVASVTNHVKVEVGTDLGQLSLGAVDLLDVVVGTQLAELLGTPEGEADGVLDLEVGERLGDTQDTDGTRAIVT